MSKTRKYNYKDVDMLLASKTISISLSENLADLSMARTTWTSGYTTALGTKIDAAIENYLGLDKTEHKLIFFPSHWISQLLKTMKFD